MNYFVLRIGIKYMKIVLFLFEIFELILSTAFLAILSETNDYNFGKKAGLLV